MKLLDVWMSTLLLIVVYFGVFIYLIERGIQLCIGVVDETCVSYFGVMCWGLTAGALIVVVILEMWDG